MEETEFFTCFKRNKQVYDKSKYGRRLDLQESVELAPN